MFHPHFFRLFFGNPHHIADTMRLVSALVVEKELKDARERHKRANSPEDKDEPYKVKPELHKG
ncbi:MAG: hypothetical protein ABSG91_18215 [Syntrophobacteraceae bacterium]|jgi:hypothetical protein